MADDVANDRTVHAMGERVAVVENELKNINYSLVAMRTTLHALAGEAQKSVALESRCVTALEMIADQTRSLPDLIIKVHSIEEMKPNLQLVINEYFSRRGGWKATIMIGTAAMGAITMIGTIAAGVVWMLGKVVGN